MLPHGLFRPWSGPGNGQLPPCLHNGAGAVLLVSLEVSAAQLLRVGLNSLLPALFVPFYGTFYPDACLFI